MATKTVNKRSVPEKVVQEASKPASEPEDAPTQDEVDAKARKIAARILKQHEKTWTELAKY